MKSRRTKVIFFFTFILLVGFFTWYFALRDKNPLKVDVSNIELEIQVQRFDKDLFSSHDDLTGLVAELEANYPDFFMLYTQQIIKIGHTGNQNFYEYLDAFLTDYTVDQARDAVFQEFEDMSDIEASLTDGFRHYKYYFPENQTPKVVSFIAGFNHSVVTTDRLIGIGLDKYLGADCEFYQMMRIPQYAVRNMRKEMIPVDCITAWAEMEFPNTDSTDYLVFEMIYEGKILYFLDAMYPEMPDSLKIGFTDRNIAYCEHFESHMWEYLVSENLLFSTDYLQRRKFMGDAPFTAAFGNDSPGRAAAWIGWQIVTAYVNENNVSLQELMHEKDFQKILNQSFYKPKGR